MGINTAPPRIRHVRTRTTAIAVVADDNRAYIKIAGALSGRPELTVHSGGSPKQLVGAEGPSCELLVFSCDAVGPDELGLLTELRRESPALLIVAVCESANGRSARRALDGSIEGLVFADQLDAALPATVSAVLAGQTVVPRDLRASIRRPSLTFREKQILGMVVMGFTNGEIGARLFLAESTIKSHLSSAFDKLGVRSRNEAAAMILDPQGSLGNSILAVTGNNNWAPPRAA